MDVLPHAELHDDEWMTIPEAAGYAKCSRRTIYRASRAGDLETVGRGRLRRTRRSWVDAWLAGLAAVLALLVVLALLCLFVAPVRHWCERRGLPFASAAETTVAKVQRFRR